MTTARAIGRSLRIYYPPGRAAALDAFHARFLAAGVLIPRGFLFPPAIRLKGYPCLAAADAAAYLV